MRKKIKDFLFSFLERFFQITKKEQIENKKNINHIDKIKQIKQSQKQQERQTIKQVEDYLSVQRQAQKESLNIPKNRQQQPKVDRDGLMQKIKRNIYYLNNLLSILQDRRYRAYYNKVQDLKYQSEQNFKIVFRIKEDAPYISKVLQAVYKHTHAISYLIQYKLT